MQLSALQKGLQFRCWEIHVSPKCPVKLGPGRYNGYGPPNHCARLLLEITVVPAGTGNLEYRHISIFTEFRND